MTDPSGPAVSAPVVPLPVQPAAAAEYSEPPAGGSVPPPGWG
jgi:hypothetical protein